MSDEKPPFVTEVLADLKAAQREIASRLPAGTLRAHDDKGNVIVSSPESEVPTPPIHRLCFLEVVDTLANDAYERHVSSAPKSSKSDE